MNTRIKKTHCNIKKRFVLFVFFFLPFMSFSQERGCVILQKDSSILSQIISPSTVYIIAYDFDLNNGRLNMPFGCELKFEGGSVRNGVISCNGLLLSGDVKLTDVVLVGTIKNENLYYSYFKNIENLVSSVKNLNCAINIDKEITIKKPLDLEGINKVVIKNIINNESSPILLGSGTNMYSYCSYDIEKCNYITIVGGKNIRCNVGIAKTIVLFPDGGITGRNAIAYSSFNFMRVNNLIISGQNGGWCNENSFFGGTFDNITITGDYAHNHNVFYNPHLELKGSINIESGHSNYFRDVRFENAGNIVMGKGTRHNIISRSYFDYMIGSHFQYINPNFVNEGDFTNVIYNILDDYDIKDYQIDRNFYIVNPTSGVLVNSHNIVVTANKPLAKVYIQIQRGAGIFVSSICEKSIQGKLELFDENNELITIKQPEAVVGSSMSFSKGAYNVRTNNNNYSFTIYANRANKKKIKYAVLEIFSPFSQTIECINVKVLGDRTYPNSAGIICPVE